MIKAKGIEFEKLHCPYDRTHQIERYRFAKHLIGCRKIRLDLPLVECPFNNTHMIPKPEMDWHVTVCADRKSFESFKYTIAPTNSVPDPVDEIPQIETAENWDEEPHVPPYDPKTYAESAPVLRLCQNAPPLERKVFRKAEHLRLRGIDSS